MRAVVLLLLGLTPLLTPSSVLAHFFGALYNLPVPFWLYLYGGAAAILVSFLIIGYFFNRAEKNLGQKKFRAVLFNQRDQGLFYPTFNLSKFRFLKTLTKLWVINASKIISVFLLLFTIATGLLGSGNQFLNFNMTFFWIIFLLGFTYLTFLIGDLYAVINPWKVLVTWFEKILGKADGFINYPKNLAYYPALVFYFLLIWVELFGQVTPAKLSLLLSQYTLLNFIGAFTFGKEDWFKYGEFFGVFFRLISKIAPIERRAGKFYLRPPFVGALNEKAKHLSLLLFVLFMLSSTAFDGFRETTNWYLFQFDLVDSLQPVLGDNSFDFVGTIGLLLSPFIFLAIYLALITLAKLLAQSRESIRDLSLHFAFTLIPIALAYNVAHYYTLLVTQGLDIIRLISDPFGFGWNLFATADFYSVGFIDANFAWHAQVAVILVGHIAGVYLTHLTAYKVFPSQRRALLSHIPMLILMIAFTMIGLWILSQPITAGF